MLLTKRQFLRSAALSVIAAPFAPHLLAAENPAAFRFQPDRDLIPAPSDPAQWEEFRRQLSRWREETRARLNYDDALYRKPEFAWAASSFCCCFLMVCDETFYDYRRGQYTVSDFLEHGRREFGGYDSVVLWHAYPRIGLDERNQFDFYRDLPGGLPGVRQVVAQFQRRGVRVYIDYNPWDTGTRREGKNDLDALVDLVKALQVDGIFLDTMDRGAADFRAKLDAARPGVILEGEIALPLERIHDHHASWAQWFPDSEAPGVLRNKWFERRHIQHQIRRWDTDHTGELHAAWMNGSGIMVWENVFGSWVEWRDSDRELLRAMLPIQRRYAYLFCGEDWVPLLPTLKAGVYASLWQGRNTRLWTLVNRTGRPINGPLLEVQAERGQLFFDIIAGQQLSPAIISQQAVLAGSIPPRGIACFLGLNGTQGKLVSSFSRFLTKQSAERKRAMIAAKSSATRAHRPTGLKPVAPTRKYSAVPASMVEIPPATFAMEIEMRSRECGFYQSIPEPGHNLGGSFLMRKFKRAVDFKRFAMDATPVTNAQFAEFLRRAKYRPKHPEHFLKHWINGKPPAGKEDHPVVYVDLDDTRAYARWAGKRLPTEEEWQYAAQGTDGRKYPWGNTMEPGRCNDGSTGGTTPVTAFPQGRSPFGCYDMCGNVWHWTESERSDGRTRFCILRGGAWFAAKGSNWYMDGGPRPCNFAAKFLMMWPGLDRCGTVGFRCVADLA